MPKIAYKEKYEEARKTIEALYDQVENMKSLSDTKVITLPEVNEELKEDVRAMTNICSVIIQNLIENPVDTADVNITLLQEFKCVLGKHRNG